MLLPARDTELVQIVDAALADAALRAGPMLACRPGCTQCCHGAFSINALDAARLQSGMHDLDLSDPLLAESVRDRARTWLAQHASDFPGDVTTGILGTSEEDQSRFEDFANDAPCPALNPDTGLCDIYAFRPLTCRVFGPPVRVEAGDTLACCELCFIGATPDEIADCEMPLPHELEEQLIRETGGSGETIIPFALLR
ncbi:YkgJ family cysteine cluster protein [Occallatibacter savannae]|uniref:YkgJ family cysteine cluster protein n=1 Tax=Occallatibacter savannae TaxID=1002691 RepID=UPI000D68D895|nr:YkgJ family cysteine cluster protein [Occallatibacter savannae]